MRRNSRSKVDEVQHFCLDEAIPIAGTPNFIGFLLFSPTVMRAHEKPGFVFPSQQMAHLENGLHAILADGVYYKAIANMPPCIRHIKLRLPAVNSTSERVCFPLQGLPPSFLLPRGGDGVLTFCHAARDFILSIRARYKTL